MADKAPDIEVPRLDLQACSVEEHCRALLDIKRLAFWWYQGRSSLFGNFSLPFQDGAGHWWYQVKPGFCWPADCFRPMDPSRARPPFARTFLGWQHVVADEAAASSRLTVNAILDLAVYGARAIDAKRRNAVRKGLKICRLEVLKSLDADTLEGCLGAWNDLTSRTGWKGKAERGAFRETWGLLLGVPGVSIIVGRDAETGVVAGFLMVKIIGDTAYVDTIASRTDYLRTNVNDAVMYAFLVNAARLEGVSKGHYAIKSNVVNLERFKTGLGFVPHPFPAVTHLRPGVGPLLRLVFPDKYNRMMGRFDGAPAATPEDE
jgi:hypothetical protein